MTPPLYFMEVVTITYQEILKLVNAGFTAEQIQAMEVEPEAEKQPERRPVHITEKGLLEYDEPEETVNPTEALMHKMIEELQQTKNAIIAGNINSSQQPAQQSADSILAQLLDPKTGKEV